MKTPKDTPLRTVRAKSPRAEGSAPTPPAESHISPPLVLIFALLALGIFAGGILSYRNYEEHFRTGVEQQLAAITELKMRQIVQWRRERMVDATYLLRTPYAARRALDVLAQPGSQTTRQMFMSWLESLFADGPCERVLLLDEHLKVGLVYPEGVSGELGEAALRAAQEALRSRQIVMVDLHRETENGDVYLSLIVPFVVRRENARDNIPAAGKGSSPTDRSAGALVLQINAKKELYPIIKFWPTPSQTAEALLVRRDGNDALYLNDVKFQTNTALRLRIPLTRTNVPAVKAALGQHGVVEGLDYRGVAVVAALGAITNSPWSMVVRMDTAEVYAPLRERLWLTVLLVSALLLSAGASVGMVWRHQRARFFQDQHRAAAEIRQEQLFSKSLLDSLPGIFYLYTYPELRLVLWNKQHETLLGYEASELDGCHVADRHEPPAKDVVLKVIEEVMEKGQGSIEASLLAKDGRRVPFLLTGVKFEANGQRYLMGTGIDLTDRQRAEDVLRESELLLRESQNAGGVGSYRFDIKKGIWISSQKLDEIFGIDGSYPRTFTGWLEIIHPEHREMMNTYLQANVLTNKELFNKEYQILRHSDQQTRWVYGHGQLLLDTEGNPETLVGTIQDITDRKQAQEQIHQQLDELRRWQAVMLGREDRIMAVKREVNELLCRLGETIRYPSQER